MVYICVINLGMTEGSIKGCGKTESSMAKENFGIQRKTVGKEEYGMMENVSAGRMKSLFRLQINKF